MIYWTNFLLVN